MRRRWLKYIKNFDWNHFELHLSQMQSVLADQEMWRLNLGLLAPHSFKKAGEKERNSISLSLLQV